MEMQGETLIAAPRASVWAALNDPAVLARCIEGVESLEKVGDTRFEGKLNAKVGPVRASFTGGVDLQNLDPPNRYTLAGEGKGGIAGFAKGSADVRLVDAAMPDGGTGTRLSYVVRSTVGGKLAQLGARLIEGTARGYAESFFARLKAELEGPATSGDATTPSIERDAARAVAATEARAASDPAADAPVDAKHRASIIWGGLALLLLALAAWILLTP